MNHDRKEAETKLLELRRGILRQFHDSGTTEERQPNELAPDHYWRSTGLNSAWPATRDLLDPDFTRKSTTRPQGSHLWDQALYLHGKPAPVKYVREVKPSHSVNETWLRRTRPKLDMLPETVGEGLAVTVKDEFIIDHLDDENQDGWLTQEAGHVLAHMRAGDSCQDLPYVQAEFGYRSDLGPYAPNNRQALAELLVSRKFGLGIDLRGREKLGPAQSTLECGVEVVSTPYLSPPYLLAEREGKQMFRFDGVGAVVLVGFATNSPPMEFQAEFPIDAKSDAWTGRPTLATFIGWTTPDILLHGPVVSLNPEYRKARRYNALHANDLFPMETLPTYIEMVRRAGNFKGQGQDFVHADAWMNSLEYVEAFEETPPWPCGTCMWLDRRTSSMPERPSKNPMTKAELMSSQPWKELRAAKTRLIKIVTPGVKAFEAECFGSTEEAQRIRTIREEGNKGREARLANERMDAEILKRKKDGKDPTKKQLKYLRDKRRRRQSGEDHSAAD